MGGGSQVACHAGQPFLVCKIDKRWPSHFVGGFSSRVREEQCWMRLVGEADCFGLNQKKVKRDGRGNQSAGGAGPRVPLPQTGCYGRHVNVEHRDVVGGARASAASSYGRPAFSSRRGVRAREAWLSRGTCIECYKQSSKASSCFAFEHRDMLEV